MSVDAAEVENWRGWIGRSERRTEVLEAESLRRFAAAIGEPLDVERVQPSLGHWAFFLPVAPAAVIGDDGHPARGGFLPPVSLPRRMFAAGSLHFLAPLALGRPAERVSTILDVVHKVGRSGDLVLVEVEHRIVQDGRDRVRETQTIVYRDAGAATPPVADAGVRAAEGDVMWSPRTVDLFRFSAATFNGHRIHYDLPYAVEEEGYPGLVVHGPFTAAKLLGHARQAGREPATFAFRALAPIFVGQPVLLTSDADGHVRAVRQDGTVAMRAEVG